MKKNKRSAKNAWQNSIVSCNLLFYSHKFIKQARIAVLLLLLCITKVSVQAQAIGDRFKEGSLYYKITSLNPKEVKVSTQKNAYPYWDNDEKPTGDITIPETVDHGGDSYSVVSILDDAFHGCSDLTSVSIPNSVTSIGGWVFQFCANLKTIEVSNSVTSIGNWSFTYCPSLTDINVDEANTAYCSEEGILFNKSKTELIKYPAGKVENSYSIPNSVTSIEDNAFAQSVNLSTIGIPNSVTAIWDEAFYNCTGLIAVNIPNSVTAIRSEAFRECTGLESVTIPNSVTHIGQAAFRECTNLSDIFSYKENISDITMSNNVFKEVDKDNCILHVPVGTINDYNNAAQWQDFTNKKEIGIAVTGISFKHTSQTMNIGVPLDLLPTVVITPSSALNKDIIWTSDNTNIATVDDNGVVTGISTGSVTIRATTVDGGFTASCVVIVLESISVENVDNLLNSNLYPTVVENGFTVELDCNFKRSHELEIYNLLGTKVHTATINKNKQFVSVSGLKTGVYLVRVAGKNYKIVKQ